MSSGPHTALNPAIIPFAVLCGTLVLGAVALVFLTRKIARVRLLRELRLAAEAKAAEERLGEKPILVDVFVGPSLDESSAHGGKLPWAIIQVRPTLGLTRRYAKSFSAHAQPIATTLNAEVSSPHPHHAIEKRPGYLRSPLVDGNVLQVSVGIIMPAPSLADGMETLEASEYCIGTADVVACSLLGARQRLIGIN